MITLEFSELWKGPFSDRGFRTFDDFFDSPSLSFFMGNSRRDVMVLDIDIDGGPRRFFVKRFYHSHLKDMLFTKLNFGSFCSLAECEWKNINTLLKNGIDTYRPVCFGADIKGGFERKSFIVTEQLAGTPLSTFAGAHWRGLDPEKKKDLMSSLGSFVRKIHQAGIGMPDLFLWHIYLKDLSKDHEFAIIDLHRMKINTNSRREQMRNLGALQFSMLDEYFTEEDRDVFFSSYASDTPKRIESIRRGAGRRCRALRKRRHKPKY